MLTKSKVKVPSNYLVSNINVDNKTILFIPHSPILFFHYWIRINSEGCKIFTSCCSYRFSVGLAHSLAPKTPLYHALAPLNVKSVIQGQHSILIVNYLRVIKIIIKYVL